MTNTQEYKALQDLSVYSQKLQELGEYSETVGELMGTIIELGLGEDYELISLRNNEAGFTEAKIHDTLRNLLGYARMLQKIDEQSSLMGGFIEGIVESNLGQLDSSFWSCYTKSIFDKEGIIMEEEMKQFVVSVPVQGHEYYSVLARNAEEAKENWENWKLDSSELVERGKPEAHEA